jgi:hypothetical protein
MMASRRRWATMVPSDLGDSILKVGAFNARVSRELQAQAPLRSSLADSQPPAGGDFIGDCTDVP